MFISGFFIHRQKLLKLKKELSKDSTKNFTKKSNYTNKIENYKKLNNFLQKFLIFLKLLYIGSFNFFPFLENV